VGTAQNPKPRFRRAEVNRIRAQPLSRPTPRSRERPRPQHVSGELRSRGWDGGTGTAAVRTADDGVAPTVRSRHQELKTFLCNRDSSCRWRRLWCDHMVRDRMRKKLFSSQNRRELAAVGGAHGRQFGSAVRPTPETKARPKCCGARPFARPRLVARGELGSNRVDLLLDGSRLGSVRSHWAHCSASTLERSSPRPPFRSHRMGKEDCVLPSVALFRLYFAWRSAGVSVEGKGRQDAAHGAGVSQICPIFTLPKPSRTRASGSF